jgi:DUF1365 family protein
LQATYEKNAVVKLLKGKVFHKRVLPGNVFCYKSCYITLPLIAESVAGERKNPPLFSVNKFNIFSFHDKDHGKRNGEKALDWAFEMLKESGLSKNQISEIILLTHPRCFGFVFNPVSFYFCLNFESNLIAVIAEVNNTFGETHSYVINEENFTPILSNKKYTATKEFFVSPFLQREGYYEFRFSYSENKIAVFIDYFKNEILSFQTSLTGNIEEFTIKNSIPNIFTTFKTVVLIGFQALILIFLKKLKFRRPPKQLNNTFTKNKL